MTQALFPLTVSFGLIFFALFLYAWIKPHTHIGIFRTVFLVLSLWCYLSTTVWLPHRLTNLIEQHYSKPVLPPNNQHNLIVVLSTGYRHQGLSGDAIRLNQAGWERTFESVALWRRIGGQIRYVGQPEFNGSTSVAEQMRRTAIEFGVPPSAVSSEGASTNTYENLLHLNDDLKSQLYSNDTVPHVWLVTSALHLPRAMGVAKKLGLEMTPYPCCYRGTRVNQLSQWLPSNDALPYLREAAHEIIGYYYYRLQGWI
jgi:uncharacterized SAM-binding protein YcdF (DUF218 family)